MSRAAVCFLLIALFQYGNQESLQSNDSSTKTGKDVSKTDVEEVNVTKGPLLEEEVPVSKKVKHTKPTQKQTEETEQTEQTEQTQPDLKEEIPSSSTRKFSPLDQLKGLEKSGTKKVDPITQARERIGETVSKSVDGVKAMADNAYKYVRDTVINIF